MAVQESSDADGRLVRPFALTGGRTRPNRTDFSVISLVTTVESPSDPLDGVQPEHLLILRYCRIPTAVAELAARLDLPFSVVTILLCDLLEAERITVRSPLKIPRTPDPDLLQKVRDGLARL